MGTCIKSIPLKSIDAAKPAISPITPPPNAIIRLLLSISNDRDFSSIYSKLEKFLIDEANKEFID